jgi:hypothetical protein
MAYFSKSIEYFKKSPARTFLIAFLDLLFYIFFIPIFNIWAVTFQRAISRMPFQLLGSALNSLELDSLELLLDMLVKILLGIIGSIILFALLVITNIVVMKTLIWMVQLKKKISYKILLKSLLLYVILSFIFLIPIMLSLLPIFLKSAKQLELQAMPFSWFDIVPFIIVSIIMLYFITLALYFIAKTGSTRKAFKNCFKYGYLKAKKIIPPFLFLFFAVAAVSKILANLGTPNVMIVLLVLLVLIKLSFMNRLYIANILNKE